MGLTLVELLKTVSPFRFSQYFATLINLMVKSTNDVLAGKIQDTRRNNIALTFDKHGMDDHLTKGHLVPYNTAFKIIKDGDGTDLGLWLLGDEFNSIHPKDRSGYGKNITRVGMPCVVLTAQSNYKKPGRVGWIDGVDDGFYADDHTHFQNENNSSGMSWSGWIYPADDAPVPTGELNPYCLSFDGVNDYLDLGTQASLWAKSKTKFSLSMWIKPTTVAAGARTIFMHGTGNGSILVEHDASVAGRINFKIVTTLGATVTAYCDNFVAGEWQYLGCVYNNTYGSDNMKIYRNGNVGTNANLTDAVNNAGSARLGDNSNDYQGLIDQFEWFDGNDIQPEAHRLACNGVEHDDESEYRLKMNEGTGTTTTDDKSGSITATLNGCTWSTDTVGGYLSTALRTLLYHRSSSVTNQYQIFIDPTDNDRGNTAKRFGILARRSGASPSTIRKVVDSFYILNNWVFFAIVWDYANSVVIYKNAVSQTLTDNKNNRIGGSSSDKSLMIGFCGQVGARVGWWKGGIYNLKCYTNKQLSGTEISNENTNKLSISNVTTAEIPILHYFSLSS